MNREQFKKIYNDRIEHARQVQFEKNDHYAYSDDVFYNFKHQAATTESCVEDTILHAFGKHLAGMVRQLHTLQDPDTSVKQETDAILYITEEKIPDMINYLILMEGWLSQRLFDKAGMGKSEGVKDLGLITDEEIEEFEKEITGKSSAPEPEDEEPKPQDILSWLKVGGSK